MILGDSLQEIHYYEREIEEQQVLNTANYEEPADSSIKKALLTGAFILSFGGLVAGCGDVSSPVVENGQTVETVNPTSTPVFHSTPRLVQTPTNTPVILNNGTPVNVGGKNPAAETLSAAPTPPPTPERPFKMTIAPSTPSNSAVYPPFLSPTDIAKFNKNLTEQAETPAPQETLSRSEKTYKTTDGNTIHVVKIGNRYQIYAENGCDTEKFIDDFKVGDDLIIVRTGKMADGNVDVILIPGKIVSEYKKNVDGKDVTFYSIEYTDPISNKKITIKTDHPGYLPESNDIGYLLGSTSDANGKTYNLMFAKKDVCSIYGNERVDKNDPDFNDRDSIATLKGKLDVKQNP